MRGCRRCLEAGFEITPGAVFTGRATAEVMVIGQAPGVTEVAAGRPFNASSGRRLFQWLSDAGWEEADFRGRHYMTAVTKCFPGKSASGRGDRVPSKEEQALCRSFLEQEVRFIAPRVIVPVGGLAIRLFYAPSARLREIIGTGAYLSPALLAEQSDPFSLDRAELLAEFALDKRADGRWVVPLPHPSGASAWPNQTENRALIDRATSMLGQIRLYWGL
jgi:uracil-DNA glycosylase